MGGLGANVKIAGVPVADTAATIGIYPTVLDTIRVDWGKSDQYAAVEPSVANIRLALPKFSLPSFRRGDTVEITAGAEAPADYPIRTVDNFQHTADLTSALLSGTAQKISMYALNPASESRVDVIPAPRRLGAPHPAWDDLGVPRIALGQNYLFAVDIDTAPGVTANLYAAALDDPAGSNISRPALIASGTGKTTLYGTYEFPSAFANWYAALTVLIPAGAGVSSDKISTTFTNPAVVALPMDAPIPTATVFHGRIRHLSTRWDDTLGLPVCQITASDILDDLAADFIGDQPWPIESAADRANRIKNLTSQSPSITLDDGFPTANMIPKDLDNRTALSELQAVAKSIGANLWPVGANALRMEDPSTRRTTRQFRKNPDNLNAEIIDAADWAIPLAAHHLDRDNFVIVNDSATAVSRVVLLHRLNPWPDPERDAQTIAENPAPNTSVLSIQTDLYENPNFDPGTALAVAARYLSRASPTGTRLDGIRWDWDAYAGSEPALADFAKLLDIVHRPGLLCQLSGFPDWAAPSNPLVNLDGGTILYAAGRWLVDLTLTPQQGVWSSITWAQPKATVRDFTWAQMDSITYAQMIPARI